MIILHPGPIPEELVKLLVDSAKKGVSRAYKRLHLKPQDWQSDFEDLVGDAIVRLLEMAGHERIWEEKFRVKIAMNAVSNSLHKRLTKNRVEHLCDETTLGGGEAPSSGMFIGVIGPSFIELLMAIKRLFKGFLVRITTFLGVKTAIQKAPSCPRRGGE